MVLGLLFLLAGSDLRAQSVPAAPSRWLTDQAGVLSPSVVKSLDTRLEGYEEATGHQFFVWIGKTTQGQPIDDWSARTFQAWKVGRKGLDDGVVLFVLTGDRTARIEVGYGLEGELPDATAHRILSEELFPRLREGDLDGAVTAAVNRLLSALGGESERAPDWMPAPWQIVLVVIGSIAFLIFAIRHPVLAYYLFTSILSRGNWNGGGGPGARGGGGRSGGGGASGRW